MKGNEIKYALKAQNRLNKTARQICIIKLGMWLAKFMPNKANNNQTMVALCGTVQVVRKKTMAERNSAKQHMQGEWPTFSAVRSLLNLLNLLQHFPYF